MTEPLDVYCGMCAAAPNEPCIDPATGEERDLHAVRVAMAKARS